MEKNKVNCKICSLQFKNYYQLKKHKKDCVENEMKDSQKVEIDNKTPQNQEYLVKEKNNFKIQLSKLNYTNIDKIDFTKLNNHQKHISDIFFNYVYKKHLEKKILENLLTDKIKQTFLDMNKSNLLNILRDSSIDIKENELLDKTNMELIFTIKKLNILFKKNDFYFYKDPIVFPLIFYKSVAEYYEKLTKDEKNTIKMLFDEKKMLYEDDEFIKMIEDNPFLHSYEHKCLYIHELIEDKNEEDIKTIIFNNSMIQSTIVELSVLDKFKKDFHDYCEKNPI